MYFWKGSEAGFGADNPAAARISGASVQAQPSAALRSPVFGERCRPSDAFSPPLAFLLAPALSGPSDIEGDGGEADRHFKPIRAAQSNPVQLAMLRIVDSRFTRIGMDRKTIRKLWTRTLRLRLMRRESRSPSSPEADIA